MIIHAGRCSTRTMTARLLGQPTLVFIGLISYSLYLWHWPLLVLPAIILDRSLTPAEAVLAVTASVGVAALSWWIVETPFRRPGLTPTGSRRRVALGIVSAVTLLAAVAGIWLLRGLPDLPPSARMAENAAADHNPLRRRCLLGDSKTSLPPVDGCLQGPGADEGRYEVVVWGDSHADHFFPAIADEAAASGLTVREVAQGGCVPLPGIRIVLAATGAPVEGCMRFHDAAFDLVRAIPDLDLLVLAARWSRRLGGEADNEHEWQFFMRGDAGDVEIDGETALRIALERIVVAMAERGTPVLILGQVPVFPQDPARCLLRAYMREGDPSSCLVTTRAEVDAVLQLSNAVIEEIPAPTRMSTPFFLRRSCATQRSVGLSATASCSTTTTII